MLSQYRDIFLEELDEAVQLMDEVIMQLEQEPNAAEHIQTLFRAAHTLKGSSGAMGCRELEQLTHEAEHVLDSVRNGQLSVTDELINLLFNVIDQIKQMQQEIIASDIISSDASAIIAAIHRLLSGNNTVQQEMKPVSASASLDAAVQPKNDDGSKNGLQRFRITISLNQSCDMKAARAAVIIHELEELGEIVNSRPSFTDMQQLDEASFEMLDIVFSTHAADTEIEHKLRSMLDIDLVHITKVGDKEESKLSNRQSSDAGTGAEKGKAQTIRVNIDRLEHLMNLVGELIIDQTRVRRLQSDLTLQIRGNPLMQELNGVSDHLKGLISDLQESVMKVRMQPIEQLFNRFPRMVRDLAQKLHKEIDFQIEGKETELDRTLIEEISDPLIHLLRNALDHGIEDGETRLLNGKPQKGTVRLRAAHEDNHIVIAIEDDGAGIDPQKIKQSAVNKGIISRDEAAGLTEQEAIHLIFHPGFSTASVISDVSGRGVGMDIVKSNIEKLNGLIEVVTEAGKGTSFRIKLPLTLAVVTGLMVGMNGSSRIFVLPLTHVVEIIRIRKDELRTVSGQTVVKIRERVIPVAWLNEVYEFSSDASNVEKVSLVILGLAEKRIALAVDHLIGNQEIVIKPLGSYLGQIDGVMGAAILGDGKVAMIVDVAGFMRKAGLMK